MNRAPLTEQHLYGASRLGMRRIDKRLYENGTSPNVIPAVQQNTLGNIAYEITNYLGNVNVVISDRKIWTGTPINAFRAVILSKTDYFPFGMEISSRTTSTQEYRYGYNGMEMDNEAKGEGNSYTTEFRQYDPRIGRWLSLDPLMAQYPMMSPYVAFNNNPIYFVDPLGLKGEPVRKSVDLLIDDGNSTIDGGGDDLVTYLIKVRQKDGSLKNVDSYTHSDVHLVIGEQRWKAREESTVERIYNLKGDLISESLIKGESFLSIAQEAIQKEINQTNTLQQNEKSIYNNNVQTFMDRFPKNGTAQTLIWWYGFGNGKNYHLTHDQMKDVISAEDNFFISSLDMKKTGNYNSKKYQGQSGATGTLGAHQYWFTGKITSENINGHLMNVFRGELHVYDFWNFNSGNREFIPEMKTRVANLFLPGSPFSVFGSISVVQYGNSPMQFATGGVLKGTWTGSN